MDWVFGCIVWSNKCTVDDGLGVRLLPARLYQLQHRHGAQGQDGEHVKTTLRRQQDEDDNHDKC